jgi:protein gp37
MSGDTRIEWTDATWNPIVGCSIVSPGCINCYAMTDAYRKGFNPLVPHYHGLTKRVNGHAVWTGKLALAPDHIIEAPLHWRKPRMVFVNSMGDLFHEDAPEAWIDRAFEIMNRADWHTYQVLTKRPERMRAYADNHKIPDHVWLGVSAEDQRRYDERAPVLREVKAQVRFFSLEPLLGPITADWFPEWIIVGGESGHGFRPMDPDWARRLWDASALSTYFFMKQMAGKAPIPADLMIRQFPDGRTGGRDAQYPVAAHDIA